jgi:hypothetical protein
MSGTDVYYYLQNGKRLERPSRCPSSIYQLMLKCWEWDEKKRPPFSQLLLLLKTDADNRDLNRTSSIPLATIPRTKALRTTLSSSTLTDENSPNRDGNDDNTSEYNSEQYKTNGNGHTPKTITQSHQIFAKDRTKS